MKDEFDDITEEEVFGLERQADRDLDLDLEDLEDLEGDFFLLDDEEEEEEEDE